VWNCELDSTVMAGSRGHRNGSSGYRNCCQTNYLSFSRIILLYGAGWLEWYYVGGCYNPVKTRNTKNRGKASRSALHIHKQSTRQNGCCNWWCLFLWYSALRHFLWHGYVATENQASHNPIFLKQETVQPLALSHLVSLYWQMNWL